MKPIIATAVTVLALFAVQSPASAGDYWHGGGHRSHARHQWRGGGSYYAPQQQYSHRYAPRYSQYSSGYGNHGYALGFRDYGGGYGHRAYGGRRGTHHGHSALHVDIGPLHFGLGH